MTMKFRNAITKLLTEKSEYLSKPKSFEDKIEAFYNADINPNLAWDPKAIWYGFPSIKTGDNSTAIVDYDRRFVIKEISDSKTNPMVTLQEVMYQQDVSEYTGHLQWKMYNVGEKIAIPANKVRDILYSKQNRPILEEVMRLNTSKPRDLNRDVWYDKFLNTVAQEKSTLEDFYKKYKEHFGLVDLDDAKKVKALVDKGASLEYIKRIRNNIRDKQNDNYKNVLFSHNSIYDDIKQLSKAKAEYKDLEKELEYIKTLPRMSVAELLDVTEKEIEKVTKEAESLKKEIASMGNKAVYSFEDTTKKEKRLWEIEHGDYWTSLSSDKNFNTLSILNERREWLQNAVAEGITTNTDAETVLANKIEALKNDIKELETETSKENVVARIQKEEETLPLNKVSWRVDKYPEELEKYWLGK